MPLDVSQVVDGNSPIPAASVRQFYELVTGAMLDQPVTLRREVSIGGNQPTSTTALRLVGVPGQTASFLSARSLDTDVNAVFLVGTGGVIRWGAGGASPPDTLLYRFASNTLGTNGPLVMLQGATPPAPGASLSILYVKSDGFWYTRAGAAGAETPIGGTNITDPLVAQVFA